MTRRSDILQVISQEVKVADFLRSVAECIKDGEVDDLGDTFIMENDDAVDTLHSFISEARVILGEEADRERGEE